MSKISLKLCFGNKISTFENHKSNFFMMNMTDIFNGLGIFFQWTFKFMKVLGQGPNIFFWFLIIALIVTWLAMQAKFNKEAKERNTLQ